MKVLHSRMYFYCIIFSEEVVPYVDLVNIILQTFPKVIDILSTSVANWFFGCFDFMTTFDDSFF